MRRPQRWFWPAILVAVCAVHARSAAQPTLAQASEDQTQSAREAFQIGKAAFDQGRYDEALQQFTQADEAVSSPNTKLMIARCLTRLGRLAEAYSSFASLIREAQSWGDGRYQPAAQAAADEQLALKPRIVMLTVKVRDPGGEATLTVAGRAVPRSAWLEPIAIDPGAFEVVLADSSGRKDSHRLALDPGVAATLELAIDAAPAPEVAREPTPAPVVPAPAASASSPRASSSRPTSALRTWGYVVGAAGLAGIAAFGVFGAMSRSDFADLEDACPERMACEPALRDTADRGSTNQTVANVSLAVGAAALATGVVLWVIGAPDDSVEVAIGADGVRVRGAL